MMLRSSSLTVLSCALLVGCSGIDGPPALVADTRDLPHTELVAGLEAPIVSDRNQLWCASLPLAWQALEEAAGGELIVQGDVPPEVEWLRASAVRPSDIQDGELVIQAGRQDAGLLDQIRSERIARGLGQAPDERPAGGATLFFTYARLEKALPFEKTFDDFERGPIEFQTGRHVRPREQSVSRVLPRAVQVDAFGIPGYDPSDDAHHAMGKQVHVWRHVDADDFVIELVPEDATDRIFVAVVPEARTLAEAWEHVASEGGASKPGRISPGDVIAIPEIDVELGQIYAALSGLDLALPEEGPALLSEMGQDLRLRLDEEGMVVRSQAWGEVSSAAPGQPRQFVCDGPFVLAAIERDAQQPWLVARIAHPELLQAVDGDE